MADNCRSRVYLEDMNGPKSLPRKSWSVLGTAVVVAALFLILAAAVWLAVKTWLSPPGAPISSAGYAWMTFCFVGMLLVGCALIALMFYSSSHGYDEREGHE